MEKVGDLLRAELHKEERVGCGLPTPHPQVLSPITCRDRHNPPGCIDGLSVTVSCKLP
jgi:hypothetical protein